MYQYVSVCLSVILSMRVCVYVCLSVFLSFIAEVLCSCLVIDLVLVCDLLIAVHRDKDNWNLSIDKLSVTRPVYNRTNVQIIGKPAYLGGRPGQLETIA